PASPAAALTERELWLLQKIEALEKRLAEVEAGGSARSVNGSPSPTATVPALAPPPGASAAMTAPSGEAAASANPVAHAAEEQPGARPEKPEPFAFADFTWLTGNSRQKEFPLAGKVFSGEVRVDAAYTYSFNQPKDNSLGGSTEVFRHNELQLTDFAVGGDLNWKNVRGRLLTQFGMYSQTQPRNDSSPGRGQWSLDGAYRYLGEAYGGYHLDAMNGINVDAGIFLSYIGLFSFYQFDNWAYQPSYVSSNTPWYF